MKSSEPIYSLRALGVLVVILFHWFFQNQNILSNATISIDLFFVLSGFFITNILLESRIKAEELGFKKTTVFKFFYLRRALRIFPIYYLTLFILLLPVFEYGADYRSNIFYYLTYTSNIFLYDSQSWEIPFIHSWSLAVEEQFYLIWPLVILLANKKMLPYIISFFVLVGFTIPFILPQSEFTGILTISCFDALGMGALLAWFFKYKSNYIKKLQTILSFSVAVCFIIYFIRFFLLKSVTVPDITLTLLVLWVITYIHIRDEQENKRFNFLFENRIAVFIGRLSYGMYMFHPLIPILTWKVVQRVYPYEKLPAFVATNFQYFFLVANFAVLIPVAWLSYKYIEQPVLGLKKYFEITPQSKEKIKISNSPGVAA